MGVRSEYQKHFKVSVLKKSLPVYYENVAFRTARREREYAHTPLCWGGDDDANSLDSDSVEDDSPQHAEVKCTGDKIGKTDKSESIDDLAKDKLHLDTPDTDVQNTNLSDSFKLSSPHHSQNSDLDEIQHSSTQKEEIKLKQATSKGAKNKTFVVRPGKQRRPDRKQKIASRPASRPASRLHTRTQTPVEHPAPFMSYGWGDVERDLCQHKTFNVRATADVHPAALRAQSRRKTTSERRAASVQKSAEDRIKAMLEVAARERAEQGIEWRSEYQQRYPAYDTSEYMRNISARANERKLCRVVYVS